MENEARAIGQFEGFHCLQMRRVEATCSYGSIALTVNGKLLYYCIILLKRNRKSRVPKGIACYTLRGILRVRNTRI